jgi:hypothetical protein
MMQMMQMGDPSTLFYSLFIKEGLSNSSSRPGITLFCFQSQAWGPATDDGVGHNYLHINYHIFILPNKPYLEYINLWLKSVLNGMNQRI